MGKPIMHSARALFLTFLALEKSKRNSTFHEDCAAAVHPEKSGQDLQRILYSLSFCLDTTASSAQVQKNEKIKSRWKPFGENLSATDTRKECTLWRTNGKRFSVSVPPLNFLLPHFANRAPRFYEAF
jgi:hypothetical protein